MADLDSGVGPRLVRDRDGMAAGMVGPEGDALPIELRDVVRDCLRFA
jgi:hypothetical protein